MKQTLKKWLLPALLLACTQLYAQEVQKSGPGLWPQFIKFNTAQPVFNKTAPVVTDGEGRTASLNQARLLSSETDAAGLEHHRYQQTHHGIPVEHATWLVHVRNGKISHENGRLVKDFPASLPKTASINAAAAVEKAKQHIGARSYKWEMADEEAQLRQMQPGASYAPKPQLVYYSGDREVLPAALRLAWKMDVYAHDPMSHQTVFVDALTGTVLGKRSLIHEADAPGAAVTAYSGSQPITADFTGALYRLRETGRGNGINTYNMKNAGVVYANAVDFTDADNNWNNVNADLDQYATDAHWGTEKTYDYFFTRFNRNSIDNAGFALNSYVHTNLTAFGYPNNINAFWDGYKMTYGDGGSGYTPLTALDIVAHEITHGLTQRTSNLVYSYESGAMNESFSDIFAAAIEFYAKPAAANWTMGENIGSAFRNMSNPNQFSHPDTYQGTFWYTGSGDNGGVHYNSGVLNFWFYLLTAGGSGTNDHGTAYAVTGIGINDAAAIAYRLNTYYLYSTADYNAARTLGIQAAEDLFGVGSAQAVQTANAFTAAGLYAPACAQVSGLAAVNVLDLSATLTWNATPGATSYTLSYRELGGSTWYSLGSTADTFKVLNSLDPGITYEWRVRSNCNANYSFAQFTTLPPICRTPTGLSWIVNGTDVTLAWDYAAFATDYLVEYQPDGSPAWTTAGTTAANSLGLTGLQANTVYNWRVRSNCSFGISPWADALFTTNTPVCGTPTGLTTTFAPGLVTRFNWNAVPGAVSYRVQFDWAGGNWAGEIGDTVTTDTSWTITGLGSGYNLQWRVAPNCGNNYGNWASTLFSTPCPQPGPITVGTVTPNTAQISWGASGANTIYGYVVQYKLSTSTTWTTAASTAATTATITGLQQGKLYDVRVRQNCFEFNSAYVQAQFTTPCTLAPAGLKTTKVTPTAAYVTWNALAGAAGYTLQYRRSSVSTWTTVTGISTNTYTISGLTAATAYVFRVQAACTVGGPGAYSSEAAFSTYCTSSGNNTQDWIDYVKIGTMERYSSFDAGGYFNTAATYNPLNVTIGTTGLACIISAGFSSTIRNQFYAVYADLNRNGSFADAGERLAGQSAITSAGNFSFTISIPSTATPGVTAVRVVMLRQPTAVQPCLSGSRGETEDYYLNLVAPASLNGFAPETVVTAAPAQESEMLVYPNPSSGRFRITPPAGFTAVQYEVINSAGNPVLRSSIRNPGILQIDGSSLPAGLYLLRLSNSEGRQRVAKLVKH